MRQKKKKDYSGMEISRNAKIIGITMEIPARVGGPGSEWRFKKLLSTIPDGVWAELAPIGDSHFWNGRHEEFKEHGYILAVRAKGTRVFVKRHEPARVLAHSS